MHEKIVIILLAVTIMAAIAAYLTTELVSDYVTLGIGGGVEMGCNDLLDNDGDGFIDYPKDPGCLNQRDNEFNSYIECDDGIDNDRDGRVDMQDYGCVSPIDVDETDCGDNICEGLESCRNCPEDCGTC